MESVVMLGRGRRTPRLFTGLAIALTVVLAFTVSGAPTPASAAGTPPTPIGYWSFNDAANLTNGSPVGSTVDVVDPTGAFYTASGKYGGGLALTGSYLNGGDTLTTLPAGNAAYSQVSWFRTSSCDNGGIVGWGDSNAWQMTAIRLLGTDGFRHYWWDHDLDYHTATNPTPWCNGTWHHIATTYDGSTRSIYYDGGLVAQDAPGTHQATKVKFTIGATNGGSEKLSGTLDDVAVYGVALTATQVASLASGGTPGADCSGGCTMSYNGNGSTSGSQSDSSSPYAYESSVTIKDQGSLTRPGYSFTGWNTQANGGGTNYVAGDSLTIDANTTLYAKWATFTPSVTYDGNGSTTGTVPVDASSPYAYNARVTVLDNSGSLARSGYTFAGWNTAASGSGTSYAAGAQLTIDANTTLYAKWTANASGGGGGGSAEPTPTPSPPAPLTPNPIAPDDPLGPILGGTGSGIPAGGLPAGSSTLLVNGVPVQVSVQPNRSAHPTSLVISAPDLVPPLSMRLEGRGDDTDPLGLTTKLALILQSQPPSRLARARSAVRVQPVAESSGSGFKASQPVKFFLLPSTYLGSLTTDLNGRYSGSVPVPAGINPGVYTLQANALAPDESVRSLSIGVLVKATAAAVTTHNWQTTVFFAPMSSALTDAAKSQLRRLVERSGKRALSVHSTGYVQPTADTANDRALSTARARSVASFLRSLGVRGVYEVRGAGRNGTAGAPTRRADVTITTRT